MNIRRLFVLTPAILCAVVIFSASPLHAQIATSTAVYGNVGNDASQSVGNSYGHVIQTLGTGLSGTLTQIDIESSNPGYGYYGSRPIFVLYACNDPTYGGLLFSDGSCSIVYADFATTLSGPGPEVQSLYPDPSQPVVLDPSKYYAFISQGNNQFDALPLYYGSSADTVAGGCFAATLSSVSPCATVSDLYFQLYGISQATSTTIVQPPPPPMATSTTPHDSVLFLPGVEASRLYRLPRVGEGSADKQLWEPGSNDDVTELYLDQNGKSVPSISNGGDIFTKDVLDQAYGSVNIYHSFLQTLSDLKTSGQIADYSAVPYDWRLSLDDVLNGGTNTGDGISYTSTSTDPYILSELRRLVASSQTGKVTIVAHSNGGLVAKALLQKLADANDPLLSHIDQLILVAVPQVGTPSALAALLHGYDQGLPASYLPLFISDANARGLGQNMESAYNFLPSAAYFHTAFTTLISFDQSLPDWQATYGDNIISKQSLDAFLTDTFDRVDATSTDTDSPDALNDTLLSDALAEHLSLDSWTAPDTLHVTEIAGWGVPSTISGINYVKGHASPSCAACQSQPTPDIVPQPTFTIDGDGTVVTPSALYSTNSASTTRVWVNEERYNKDQLINNLPIIGPFFDKKHANILEVPDLNTFISEQITNSTTTSSQYISSSAPISSPGDPPRLVYALHSPLSFDMYDDFGHHTGISTSTGQIEEQIPGTYFLQFGDQKYIFTDAGTPAHIDMSGYATSTFTFTISELQGDNTISTLTFQDIPTTPQTKVSMDVPGDITTASPLVVDSNGDASADIVLTPSLNNVVTYTPPAILPAPTSPEPVVTPVPILSAENGPIVQAVARVASSTIFVSTTTPISTSTASIIVTVKPIITITQKLIPKPVSKKPIQPVQKQIATTTAQTAQVISASPGLIHRFFSGIGNFIKRIVLYIKH